MHYIGKSLTRRYIGAGVSIIQVPPSVDGLVIHLISKSILMPPPEQSGCIEGYAILPDGIHVT